MRILLCVVALGVAFSTTTLASISDSLVSGLSCQELNPGKIYEHINVQAAFSSDLHIPFKNWDFSTGLYDLAACWSLARTQRLSFYLNRWSSSKNYDSQTRAFSALEMIRGSSPYTAMDRSAIKEFPLKEFFVLENPEPRMNLTKGLFADLNRGVQQEFNNDRVLKRNFKSEIEFYQKRRFHDFIKNIRYLGGDGPRLANKNFDTKNALIKNLNQNKLTLLLLRPKRYSQHVVLVKRFSQTANGLIDFFVYDSNHPERNQRLSFSESNGQFYASEILQGLPGVDNPQAPPGVYIVDEDEHDQIAKALQKYYRKLCREEKI